MIIINRTNNNTNDNHNNDDNDNNNSHNDSNSNSTNSSNKGSFCRRGQELRGLDAARLAIWYTVCPIRSYYHLLYVLLFIYSRPI